MNPNSSLECEVVFYPSFYAPLNGSFNLSVEGGNQLELRASAEVGATDLLCTCHSHDVGHFSGSLEQSHHKMDVFTNTS